jgi:hypothetical protein
MQTYGIEIESFGLTEDELKTAIESVEGLSYAGHFGYHGSRTLGLRSKQNGTHHIWASERDGSLHNSEGRGMCHEVVTPLLYGKDGLKTASKVMKAMSRAGAKVNKSCGTHVTLGVGNCFARFKRMGARRKALVAQNVVDIYTYFYAGFCDLVSPSRRQGSPSATIYGGWAYLNRVNALVNNQTWGTHDDKRLRHEPGRGAVNLQSFHTAGIIEFRQHNGTLNGQKIGNWAQLMHRILSVTMNENHESYGVDVRHYTPDLEGLMAYLRVPVTLQRAFQARREELGSGFKPSPQNSEWLRMFWNAHADFGMRMSFAEA